MMRRLRIGPVAALALGIGAFAGVGTTGTAHAQDRSADRAAGSAFQEGYRAGMADERRFGEATASRAPRGDPAPGGASERLELARDLLLDVIVMLRRSPPGERRDAALVQAREALIRAQNAFTWVPRDDAEAMRRSPPLEHGWGERASGGPRG